MGLVDARIGPVPSVKSQPWPSESTERLVVVAFVAVAFVVVREAGVKFVAERLVTKRFVDVAFVVVALVARRFVEEEVVKLTEPDENAPVTVRSPLTVVVASEVAPLEERDVAETEVPEMEPPVMVGVSRSKSFRCSMRPALAAAW